MAATTGALRAQEPPAQSVLRQLVARNAFEVHAFSGIVSEYAECQERSRVLEVRVVQLEKEAAELQAENQTLATTVALAKESQTRSEEVRALEEKTRDLNGELVTAYKDKSKLAEDLLQTSIQLQIVRENNEMQAKQLNEYECRIVKLQQQLKELSSTSEKERAAHALAVKESERRLAAKEAAMAEAEKLRAENTQLINKVVAMKVEQAELLNQAVQEHESAVRAVESAKVQRQRQEQVDAARSMSGEVPAGEGLIRKRFSTVGGGMTQHHAAGGAAQIGSAEDGASWEAPPCLEAVRPSHVLCRLEAHAGGCYSICFSRSGFRLATAGGDRTVRLWDPESGSGLSRLEGTLGTVLDVAFTCDDQYVLGAGSDRALRLWDANTGRIKHTLTGHSDKVCTVYCSPADPAKAVSGGTDRTVKIWNLERGFIDRTIVCHSSINAVTTTMDGQIVISGHFDGAIRFWDLRSSKAINEVTGLHGQQITSVSVCSRSNSILTSSKDDTLKLVNIASHEVGRVLRSPGHLASKACLSPDDRYAACGLAEGGVCIWDATTGNIEANLHSAKGHCSGVQLLATAWSPDGRFLASCDRQGAAVVWHAGEKEPWDLRLSR